VEKLRFVHDTLSPQPQWQSQSQDQSQTEPQTLPEPIAKQNSPAATTAQVPMKTAVMR
jgi:hypothetical protein